MDLNWHLGFTSKENIVRVSINDSPIALVFQKEKNHHTKMWPFYLAILTPVAFDNEFVVRYGTCGADLAFQLTNQKSEATRRYSHGVTYIVKKRPRREICKVRMWHMLCSQISLKTNLFVLWQFTVRSLLSRGFYFYYVDILLGILTLAWGLRVWRQALWVRERPHGVR